VHLKDCVASPLRNADSTVRFMYLKAYPLGTAANLDAPGPLPAAVSLRIATLHPMPSVNHILGVGRVRALGVQESLGRCA
jgi:hypothetical protein